MWIVGENVQLDYIFLALRQKHVSFRAKFMKILISKLIVYEQNGPQK